MTYPSDPTPPPPTFHQHPRNNGLAVASMVLGIVGVITFPLLAIPPLLAVIFGAVALRQIAMSGGMQTGTGMAIAGIVLGVIEIVVFVTLLAAGGGSVHVNVG